MAPVAKGSKPKAKAAKKKAPARQYVGGGSKPPGYPGAGRPSKRWDMIPRVDLERVTKLCLLGLTNEQLAASLGIEHDTLSEWIAKDQDFSVAVYNGREGADAEVTAGLHLRAKGFTRTAVKIMAVAQGAGLGSTIEKVEFEEYYPPDVGAATLWLTNRRRGKHATGALPEGWSSKTATEVSGPGGGALVPPVINVEYVSKKVDE